MHKYQSMLEKEIQKDYKKESEENVEKVNDEHAKTANELEIADRMVITTPRQAFIALIDHKSDFNINPTVRLSNPGSQNWVELL